MRTLVVLFVFLCAFAVLNCAAQRQITGKPVSLDRDDYPELFQDWKAQFGKSYSSDLEESRRFANFVVSIDRARARNRDGNTQAHGLGPFADLSQDEFAERYLMRGNVLDYVRMRGAEIANRTRSAEDAILSDNPLGELIRSDDGEPAVANLWVPNKVYDWKNSGKTSPIKDQGQCGSCWAFSATEQVESNYALRHGKLPANLSEQQVVDCDTESYGCNGGWPGSAYSYLQNIGGQETNAVYPYTATDGTCHDTGAKVVHVTGYHVVGENDESAMFKYVAQAGPLSVCLDATSLQDYVGGQGAILQASSCNPNNINHCVQLTGYKASATGQSIVAWNMRNSWGTWWGNSGYALLQYGKNTCGLTSFPTAAAVS